MADLHSARLKLQRARSHLAEFDAALEAWTDQDPLQKSWIRSAGKAYEEFHVGCTIAPPETLGVLAGDFAHNVRSALDNGLVEIYSTLGGDLTTGRGRNLQYPIIKPGEDLDSKLRRKLPRSIPTSVATTIRKYQQRARATGRDWLWDLAALNNSDKHMTVSLAAAVATSIAVRVPDEGYCGDLGTFPNSRPLTLKETHPIAFYGLWGDIEGSPRPWSDDEPLPARPTVSVTLEMIGIRGSMRIDSMKSVLDIGDAVVDDLRQLPIPAAS